MNDKTDALSPVDEFEDALQQLESYDFEAILSDLDSLLPDLSELDGLLPDFDAIEELFTLDLSEAGDEPTEEKA